MKHIKLFENYSLDEANEPKFVWKQNAKGYGKSSIGHDNTLRAWHMTIHGQNVASLYNSGYLATSLGGDMLDQWKVSFITTSGNNITMTKRFEKDQLEDAKKFTQDIYTKAINTPDDSKDENMLKIKSRIKIPVKIVKDGPFKDVLKLLRAKMGDRFKDVLGTDNTFKPVRYGHHFDVTGKFTWGGSGKPDHYVQILQDALGDAYTVTSGNREIILTKNETH